MKVTTWRPRRSLHLIVAVSKWKAMGTTKAPWCGCSTSRHHFDCRKYICGRPTQHNLHVSLVQVQVQVQSKNSIKGVASRKGKCAFQEVEVDFPAVSTTTLRRLTQSRPLYLPRNGGSCVAGFFWAIRETSRCRPYSLVSGIRACQHLLGTIVLGPTSSSSVTALQDSDAAIRATLREANHHLNLYGDMVILLAR